jgi:hypothetical protein
VLGGRARHDHDAGCLPESMADLPNLLDRNWGLYKQVTPYEDADLLYVQDFDAANHRFAYQYTPTPKQVVTDFGTGAFEPSVWRMQVGVHYAF